jgi:hypothetical protein
MRFAANLHQVEPLDLKRFKRVEVNALHLVGSHGECVLEPAVFVSFVIFCKKFSG